MSILFETAVLFETEEIKRNKFNPLNYLNEYFLVTKSISEAEAKNILRMIKEQEVKEVGKIKATYNKMVNNIKSQYAKMKEKAKGSTEKLKKVAAWLKTKMEAAAAWLKTKLLAAKEKAVAAKNATYGKLGKKGKIGVAAAGAGLATFAAAKIYKNYMSKAARACAGKTGADKQACIQKYKEAAAKAKAKALKK